MQSSRTASSLQISDLSLDIERRPILRDFSLQLAPGDKVVLAGRSGCGKSTILSCILGFVVPQSGTITVDGARLSSRTAWQLRRQIAYLPQEPDLGPRTAWEGISELLECHANQTTPNARDALERELGLLGLPPTILDQRATDASGGERQRIGMALALMLNRPLLLLDEPTSALDSDSTVLVYDRIRSLTDTTVLLVSHDDSPRLEFADRIIHLRKQESL